MMNRTLSLVCLLGATQAMKIEQCCGGSVTTCCPSNDKSEDESIPEFREDPEDVQKDIIEDINDIIEEEGTDLLEENYEHKEAFETTKWIFEWLDADNSNVITLDEVEAALDYDISRGFQSNRNAQLVRDYFHEADADADYMINFDDFYEHVAMNIDSGEQASFDAIYDEYDSYVELVIEWVFDATKDYRQDAFTLSRDEWTRFCDEDRDDTDDTSYDILMAGFDVMDAFDGEADEEISQDDIQHWFKALVEDDPEQWYDDGESDEEWEYDSYARDVASWVFDTATQDYRQKASTLSRDEWTRFCDENRDDTDDTGYDILMAGFDVMDAFNGEVDEEFSQDDFEHWFMALVRDDPESWYESLDKSYENADEDEDEDEDEE